MKGSSLFEHIALSTVRSLTNGCAMNWLSKAAIGFVLLISPATAFAQCAGYSGPGGPCYTGPGGGLYTGPGGGAYTGPGGGAYTGPGGGAYSGPGGPCYSGPGSPPYDQWNRPSPRCR